MITTERLTLRRPIMADAHAITAILQDVEVAKWLTNPPFPYTLADAEAYIALDHEEDVYAIVDEAGICGVISLRSELGYYLAQDRWGRGYMKEAASVLVDAHFELSDKDLESGHFVDNTRSRAVLVSLGFKDTEVDRHYCPARDAALDNQKMVLTRAAWEAKS
ncbi:GNAT family N-acetyltransferase [Octadecabacter sp. CECT 8868]|uniref:GNAT family N-acetyltransferase n=1 Tax=Octadecabacter algicola TaxID=2909342 RepID=UPI001F41F4A4|nr:GNAT family N-acetyltransferase [Octadecabacter algicola]MCF2903893.1 GNAT family N-acetyltransferase [Octadecabacter algicola]